MLKIIRFFTSFFVATFSDSYGTSIDFSNLSQEELKIFYNILPPSSLTVDGDICGDRSLYLFYKTQVEKAILDHRATPPAPPEKDLLLADAPFEDDEGSMTDDPLPIIESPKSSSSSSSLFISLSSLSALLSASDAKLLGPQTRKRTETPVMAHPRKRPREPSARRPLKIREKHKVFLETLLRQAHENNHYIFQADIHMLFQKEFSEVPLGSLRFYTFVAKYSLGLLDTVPMSKDKKISGEIEMFTYNLVKMNLLSGRRYSVKRMFITLSREYPDLLPGIEESLSFYMRAMRQGLIRQFKRENKILPVKISFLK